MTRTFIGIFIAAAAMTVICIFIAAAAMELDKLTRVKYSMIALLGMIMIAISLAL
ncbi:MAG: hypothetical protein HYZ46_01860 [Nitrosomonadales bacterium]|nr:hypothetical protein [Nitrosomonadales bacterium]